MGGLDVDFIQQNVYNDPEAAWRQLQDLESGNYGANFEGGYDDGQGGYDQGYGQQQIPEEQPQRWEPPDESMMTPRTLAAQRL